MKTKTPFNIAPFIPNSDDIQYAGQISDYSDNPGKIGRILVITKHFSDGDNHRLSVFGYLIHVDIETNEKKNSYKESLEDWIMSDAYNVVLRDAQGFMLSNSDFIAESDRLEGVDYTELQLTPYKVLPAYIRFARMLKTFNVPTQTLWRKIVDMEDEFSNIFDVYGNIQEYLINRPLVFEDPVNAMNKQTK